MMVGAHHRQLIVVKTVGIELDSGAGSASPEEAHPAAGPHRGEGIMPAPAHPGRIDGEIEARRPRSQRTRPIRPGASPLVKQVSGGALVAGQLEERLVRIVYKELIGRRR